MKKMLLLAAVTMLAVTSVQAQRLSCIHNSGATRGEDENYGLPAPMDFDSEKTYRQPVVLISFSNLDFSMDNPKDYYDRLFNEKGFNSGAGLGCVADYFRDQSGGRLNLQFDIYGPIKIDDTVGGATHAFYDISSQVSALKQLYETEQTDFSIYDWDGDGTVNQVVFVTAGYSGEQKKGYIYPTTGYVVSKLPGDIYLHFGSVSNELWEDGSLNGIGTIVHEFCHCLGLPDIYPMAPATTFSAVDEWDLMDGGNYTNRGWCPPNLTAMERMYLGWDTPEELTAPTTIEGMKPLSEGGKTYIIRNSANSDEYYLLENRRQTGWDYGCPGNGLLIYHIDYDKKSWRNSQVNVSDTHFRYDIIHASGWKYKDWCPQNDSKDKTRWTEEDLLRSRYFSTSPYPYIDPTTLTVKDSLTDNSSPAAKLFTPAEDGRKFMGKPITNIKLATDGTVSFTFMGGEDTGIEMISDVRSEMSDVWYTIDGRRLPGKPTARGLYLRRSTSKGGKTTKYQIY